MASNLRVQKADYSTPQLKRGMDQHEALRSSSKAVSQLLIQSRVQRGTIQSRLRIDHHLTSQNSSSLIPRETSRFIPPSSLELPIQSKVKQGQVNFPPLSTILSKHKNREETSTKDGSAFHQSTFSEQQSENASAHVKEINQTFKNMISQNLKAAAQPRERMGYNHTYEERKLPGEIWVSQPRDIPKRVFEVKQALQGNQNNEEVNCLQGFLNELGLFYYSIGNTLLFFDAENINLQSTEIFTMEISNNALTGLLGIQVFVLGSPYFHSNKDVMILLQPYTGQIYDYSLKTDLESGKRILNLKFRESFPLPHQRPNKLVKSSKGFLYCVDDKGGIFKIDFNQSFWQLQKRQLATKRLHKSALAVVKNTTKFLSHSLRIFAKCIKNYTFSFFSTRPIEVQLRFDETKEIIVVFIKEENRVKDGGSKFVQYFHIYDEKSSELLYILRGEDCLIKDEEIVIFRKLEQHSNTKYNFILLLESGKRILLEVHNDRLRKSATIKAPPSNTGDSSIKVQDQPASSPYDNLYFLKQDMMGIMIATNYYYVVLTRPGFNETENVSYVRVESGQFCSIYHRANHPFGYRKRCLLEKQNKLVEATLPQFSRQVFYMPQELYYATDQTIQKIKMLRPIDIFYSLFQTYSQNVPRFFKAIQKTLPEADSLALLSFCCQLLVDSQGSYLLSRQFQQQMNNKHNRQSSSSWSVFQLQHHSFKDIDRRSRERLLGIMVDIAINAGKTQKQEKQKFVVEGSLQYYSRLLQIIFFTNINILTSELCKIMGYLLQQYRKFLQELQGHLKCDMKSYLGKAMRWTNRFWQLMILCKDIPNLPDLSLDEALVQNPQCFDKFIFQFLVKECKEQVFGQIKKLMPSFITERFTNVYRLYCEIVAIKDASNVLEICKNYTQLPDYFIDYLIKSKGIPEAALLRDIKSPQKQPQVIATYQEKMKDFYSKRTTLYEKEQILLHAIILLKQAPENAKIGEQLQAHTLMGQLKLQELIIETYHHRLINKPLWVKILSCIVPDPQSRGEQKEVMEKLNTCLLDPVLLGEVVENLNDALLKVMYAYYLTPKSFEGLFFALAESLFQQSQGSLVKLSEAFREELHFMLSKAKLGLQFQETMIIIDTYITLLTQCKDLGELMSSSMGLLKRQTFWPLSYCAELGIDANRLYSWGVGKFSDYSPQKLPYLQLCLAHFVRDFLPIKRNELSRILNCEQSGQIFLKQISVLLS